MFSPAYSFFLTTGSCVSEPPYWGFLCVRIRDTLNRFLEWGNLFKRWPHFKQKIALHELFYKGLHRTGIKIYVSKLWLYEAGKMVKAFDLIYSNLAPPSKIQNLFGHMTPLSRHCHIALLRYQVIVQR